jgi:MFS family permease
MNDPSAADPPSLGKDASFWGITATQFFGAFNDNVYKQILLLLFVAVPVGDNKTEDKQMIAMLVFALPFILFSGYAGYLSDRWSKTRVIVACKLAEIVIMSLGVIGFLAYQQWGLTSGVLAGMATVLFCMGTHSAFFGPSKYGVLPGLFRERDLPAANGVVLMTTFLAIILGSALAGLLMHWWGGQLWLAGCVCVAIAGVGVGTALFIRRLPAAAPELKFEWEVLFIPREIMQLLRADSALRNALMASTIFWLAAAIVQPAVNALGKRQLQVDDRWTSLLVTVISLGIAIGSALAGFLSAGKVNPMVQRTGAWGMFATLLLMSLRGGPRDHLLDYDGSLVVLIVLGVFTGMFAVPLQVFLQSKPPAGDKGRMIATQNLLNWIGICASGGIYFIADWFLQRAGWPNNGVFALTALLMLPIALFYRPSV